MINKKIILLILLFSSSCSLFNPLRRSEENIKIWLLEKAPLGTSMNEVIKLNNHQHWQISYINEDEGFQDQRVKPAVVIGKKSIRSSLGDYQDIPCKANVTVFWGFDGNSRLIDIWVWKTWDGL